MNCISCNHQISQTPDDPTVFCPKCGHRLDLVAQQKPAAPVPKHLADARRSVGKIREKKQASVEKRKQIVVAGAGLILIYLYFFRQPAQESEAALAQVAEQRAPCGADDAGCLASRIAGRIQSPCAQAIERQISRRFEWTDGALERKFEPGGWYEPGRSVIFLGRHLMAQNVFGADERLGYFCVTTAAGSVIKAGIPDYE